MHGGWITEQLLVKKEKVNTVSLDFDDLKLIANLRFIISEKHLICMGVCYNFSQTTGSIFKMYENPFTLWSIGHL